MQTRHIRTAPTVVGYDTTSLPQYGKCAGGAFIPVSAERFDLMDITVVGYKDAQGQGQCEAGVTVQTLDKDGGTTATYEWWDIPGYYGWYPVNEEQPVKRGDITVQPGEGLWFNSTSTIYGFESSGEVATAGDIETKLPQYGYTIANPTPVTVDLVDCEVTGYKDEKGEGQCEAGVTVQTLDKDGGTTATYEWWDIPGYWGWYPVNDETPLGRNIVTMEPGLGLWLNSNNTIYHFVWPKVEIGK